MKAISLHQPWATAVAIGLKKYETRGRRWNYLGPVAIHAAQKRSTDLVLTFINLCLRHPEIHGAFRALLDPSPRESLKDLFLRLPFGAVVCTVDIVAAGDIDFAAPDPIERALGDYSPGRFFQRLENVHRLTTPIPYKGHQGWFEVPDSLLNDK